jgi:hypothetical protein
MGGGQIAVPGIGGRQSAAAVIFLGLAIVGLISVALAQRGALWVPFFWFLAPLPILAFTSAREFFPPRYVLYFATVYTLLAGRGAAAIFRGILVRSAGFSPSSPAPGKTSGRKTVIAPLIAGALVAGPLLVADVFGLARYYANEKQDWRCAMQFVQRSAQSGDYILAGDHWTIYGMEMYRDQALKKRLVIVGNVFSWGGFDMAVRYAENVWYIHWAELPPYIQKIVNETMIEVRSFPGFLGTVRVMRKKSYRQIAPIVPDKLS